MSSGIGSVTFRYAVALTTKAFSATAAIKAFAASVFALSLLFAATGYAEEAPPQPPKLQQHSLLNLSKPPKAPRSYIIKAACPSYSACCCVIGGYSHCMTRIECSAIGGGCTGKC